MTEDLWSFDWLGAIPMAMWLAGAGISWWLLKIFLAPVTEPVKNVLTTFARWIWRNVPIEGLVVAAVLVAFFCIDPSSVFRTMPTPETVVLADKDYSEITPSENIPTHPIERSSIPEPDFAQSDLSNSGAKTSAPKSGTAVQSPTRPKVARSANQSIPRIPLATASYGLSQGNLRPSVSNMPSDTSIENPGEIYGSAYRTGFGSGFGNAFGSGFGSNRFPITSANPSIVQTEDISRPLAGPLGASIDRISPIGNLARDNTAGFTANSLAGVGVPLSRR